MPRHRNTARSRYPSGQIKPERNETPPTLVRRIIDQAKRGCGDPLLGSELGRLRLNGVLTDRQVAAGKKFGELVGSYDRIKGIPSRHAKSPSWQVGAGRSTKRDTDQAVIDDVSRRFQTAFVLLANLGGAVRRAVFDVTVYDNPVTVEEQRALIRGLDKLVELFGLGRTA